MRPSIETNRIRCQLVTLGLKRLKLTVSLGPSYDVCLLILLTTDELMNRVFPVVDHVKREKYNTPRDSCITVTDNVTLHEETLFEYGINHSENVMSEWWQLHPHCQSFWLNTSGWTNCRPTEVRPQKYVPETTRVGYAVYTRLLLLLTCSSYFACHRLSNIRIRQGTVYVTLWTASGWTDCRRRKAVTVKENREVEPPICVFT